MHEVSIKVASHTPKDRRSSPGLRTFLRHPLTGLLGLIVVVALIPLTIYMAQQQQDIRQHAAGNNCYFTAVGQSDGTVAATAPSGSNVKWYVYDHWQESDPQQWTDNPPRYIDQSSGTTFTYPASAGMTAGHSYQLGAVIDNTTTCLGWVMVPPAAPGNTVHVPDFFKNTIGKVVGPQLSQSVNGSSIYNVYGKANEYDAYIDDGSSIHWVENRSGTSATGADPHNFTLQDQSGNAPIWLQDSMQVNVAIPTQLVTLTYHPANACGSSSTAFLPYSTMIVDDSSMTWPGLGAVETIKVRYDYFGDYEFWWYAKGYGPVAWERHVQAGGVRNGEQTQYANGTAGTAVAPNCSAACGSGLTCSTPTATPPTTPGAGTPGAGTTPGPGTPAATAGPGTPTVTPTGTPGTTNPYCGYTITGTTCTQDSTCGTGNVCGMKDAAGNGFCLRPPTGPVSGCTTENTTPTVTGAVPTGGPNACTSGFKPVTVVFVGDSYDTDAHFQADVSKAETDIQSVEPYHSNTGMFKFLTLNNPQQSLTCSTNGKLVDFTGGNDNFCLSNQTTADTLAQNITNTFPTIDQTPGFVKVIVLVNTHMSVLGNTGYTDMGKFVVSIIQNQDYFDRTVIHEIDGHLIGKLYDRYIYPPTLHVPQLIDNLRSNCTDNSQGETWWKDVGGTPLVSGGTAGQGCMRQSYFAPAANSCPDPRMGTLNSIMSAANCWSQTVSVGFDATEQYWIKNFIIPKYTCSSPGATPTGGASNPTPRTGTSTPIPLPTGRSPFQKVNITECRQVCVRTQSGNVCTLACPTPTP